MLMSLTKRLGINLILMNTGSFFLTSVADKIYEEDNEIYSSTQHNEEENKAELSEVSHDELINKATL